MKNLKFLLQLLGILFIFGLTNSFAQNAGADTTQARSARQGEIIEAGEALIQIQIEKPQVQLFSQRIKPEFDEVNLEKSFVKEILDEGQSMEIETAESQSNKYIDIKNLLNKNR
jgi:hypothetical protein